MELKLLVVENQVYFEGFAYDSFFMTQTTKKYSETFRNCADIAITSNTGGLPPIFVGSSNPYLLYYKDLRAPSPQNVFPLVVR